MSKWPYVGKALRFFNVDDNLRQTEHKEVITSVTSKTVYYVKTVGNYNGVTKTHFFKFDSLEDFERWVE